MSGYCSWRRIGGPPHARSAPGRPGTTSSPSPTTTPGGLPVRSTGPPTTSPATLGSGWSRPASTSVRTTASTRCRRRWRAAGWDLVYAADVVAHHHPAERPPSVERRALVQRNDLLTLWLRRPARPALVATACLACRAPHDAVARRALAGALRRLPRALAARRRLPPHVERALRLLEDTDRRPPAATLPERLPWRPPRRLRPRHRRATDAAAQRLEEPFPITDEPIDAEALARGGPSRGADPPSELSVVEQAVHDVDQPCDVGVDEAVHAVVDDRGQLRRP